MLAALYQRIGESDCETLGDGFFAQPINTLSSATFSVVGVVIIWWATRAEGTERVVRLVFGVLMVLTGVGSVMFHGTQGPGSQFGHDVAFLVTVWFVASVNVAQTYRWKPAVGWMAFAVGALVLAVTLVVSPGVTNVLMVATVVSLVVSDIALHRRGTMRTWWYVASLVAIVIAVVMFLLGRTGAPLCDPDSLFQGHGIWHVLAAVALGTYFVATSEIRTTESERTRT